jgi:hypothetical protein
VLVCATLELYKEGDMVFKFGTVAHTQLLRCVVILIVNVGQRDISLRILYRYHTAMLCCLFSLEVASCIFNSFTYSPRFLLQVR